ncbi:zinc finger protein 654 isoform X2 [Cebus imitator]|uniref:zinc finger protein 654 isoform X2 n=1 Tax=Cebus imitator TaxID=2715852 RepID=UPI001896FEE5|nr:zinc finger protein 654 isoform X2 [Cebus imitator]
MAEEESDQEAERLGEELVAIVESPLGPVGLRAAGDGRGGAGSGSCGAGVGISSRDYCRRFCQVVEDYAGRWQVPLPQLQVLQTALCCFTTASASFPDECEHVQYVLSSLAVSFFELLLFFGRDEFYEEPLKDILGSFQHLLKTDCKSGIDIICNAEKEGKTMLALQLCESFLIPQLQNGDMYCIWELIFIWSKLQLKSNPSKQVFVDQCYQLLRTATNVRVIFPFMKIIKDEVEEEGLQICVEICGCALQLDLHDDPKTKCLIYKTIAHFLPNDLEILRICALSIFFLERSLEAYRTVEELYKRPDEEYNEGTSSVQNRVRFELLPILKKGLFFDPEFWNFVMIKKNCVALLSDKSAVRFLNESTLENNAGNLKRTVEQQGLDEGFDSLTDQSTGETDPDDASGVQPKGQINTKKSLTALNTSRVDHSVPRHRCMLCNKEFLGGHIVRHAQAHQKKGSFACVICGRKFRNRGLMQKHLKNHVKKIQRQQIAAAQQDDQEVATLEEINCSSISFENGNSDSKDLAVETLTSSSEGNKEVIPEHVAEFIEIPISVPEDVIENVIENGSPDTSLNNVLKPLPECGDDYEEEEDEEGDYEEDDYDLNQETSVIHKINGIVCHPKDIYATDQEGNFKCPALGCVRIFKRIGFLNKHAMTVHPTDLNVRQTVMKWSKGKCKYCQRQFEDSQHFIDHLNRHSYPNVYFCLHFNCNESFKLPFQLAQHTKSHRIFQAQCSFPECHELFEDLPLLYEHEAQHYLSKTPESSAQPSETILWDVHTDSDPIHQEKDSSSNEKQTISLPVSTSKSRKDSTEPKTCIESMEEKTDSLVQNGNERSDDTVSNISLIDQKMPDIEPNSENNCSSSDLVNGHSEVEQTPLVSSNPALKMDTNRIRTENGSILPSVVPQEHNTLPVSQALSKPNLTSEHTSYGLILTKPYVRPLPPSYLDERYLSMPKRRKFLTDRVDACSDQDNVYKKSVKRLRCGKCLTTYCNAEALEAHLAQKKCQTLFGFDSDDESA